MNTLVSTARRRRRAALAAMLALAGLPLLVTSSMADAETSMTCPTPGIPCVIILTVTTDNGEDTPVGDPVAFELTAQGSDLTAQKIANYQRRTKAGGTATTPPQVENVEFGYSLKKVLTGAGSANFSETPNPNRVPSVLSKEHLGGTTAFTAGQLPAVFVTGNRVGYARPLLKGDRGDVNKYDIFTLDSGKPLILTLHKRGHLLALKIKASPEKINTGTTVSFSADVEPPTDEKLEYTWNFTGGSKAHSYQAAPTHRYKKKDTYAVNLTVRGEDGSYGRAATTTIKVGNPPKPPKTPSNGGSGGGSGDGIGGGGGGSGYIPPFVPNSPTIPSDGLPNEEPPIDDFPTAPVDDGLEQVEGFVLAGAGSEQGESIPGTDAAAQPTEANELSTTRKISGAAIGALAVLLLLGLGAEIETRWLSTRLGHLRRRA